MTDKTTEALKLAEEALEEFFYDAKEQPELWEALAAIREALAEPGMNLNCPSVQARLATIWGYVKAEQEKQYPVAFKFPREPKPENAMGWTVDYGLIRDIALERIYAAPVSAKREWVDLTDEDRREWVDLTDEDRRDAFESLPNALEGFLKKWGWLQFAKEIERRCKEKNK